MNKFQFFDSLLYADKPDLGLPLVLTTGDISGLDVFNLSRYVLIVPDLEQTSRDLNVGWHWDVRDAGQHNLVMSCDAARDIFSHVRDICPGVKLGCYGIDGLEDNYWTPNRDNPVALLRLRMALACTYRRILPQLDCVTPSLYAFYYDLDGWERAARFAITEARKWGLPVYPFIWPDFHDSSTLAGMEIPTLMWERILNVLTDCADGAILWGGWKKSWNKHSAWWQITKRYL